MRSDHRKMPPAITITTNNTANLIFNFWNDSPIRSQAISKKEDLKNKVKLQIN